MIFQWCADYYTVLIYFVMFQYIPNEVSTKPAAKEDDKGESFYSSLFL